MFWVPSSVDPKTETRSYSRTAHYDRVQNRTNYSILTGHKVAKLHFSQDHRSIVTTGVKIISRSDNSSTVNIKAKKEIILASGAIHTPQILQLSGVGPRAVLDSANISQVLQLPGVGQNFQDHSWFPMGYECRCLKYMDIPNPLLTRTVNPVVPNRTTLTNNQTFFDWASDLWETNRTGQYSKSHNLSMANRSGPFSVVGGGGSLAQISLPVMAPDVYASIAEDIGNQDPASFLPDGADPTIVAGYKAQLALLSKAAGSNNTAWLQMGLGGNPFGSQDQWGFNIHPLSRGTVNLDPINPNGEPLVDYRMLSNPVDLRVAIALFRGLRIYWASDGEMKKLSPVETKPGLNVTSDADIGSYLTSTLNPSEYHPVGTCPKMPLELGGVVDENLRVHGIHGLRIVDASIMPLTVGATTQATVYAIAEKVRIEFNR